MAFKFNYDDLGYEKVAEGIYEGVVQNVSEQYTPNSGKKYLAVSIIIRNDIQQLHQNALLTYNIWTTNKSDVKNIEGYVEFSLALMCKACGLPEEINVSSVHELSALWIRKPVRITVSHNEYNGKSYANISKIEKSDNSEVNHTYKQSNVMESTSFIPSQNDEMIPF